MLKIRIGWYDLTSRIARAEYSAGGITFQARAAAAAPQTIPRPRASGQRRRKASSSASMSRLAVGFPGEGTATGPPDRDAASRTCWDAAAPGAGRLLRGAALLDFALSAMVISP